MIKNIKKNRKIRLKLTIFYKNFLINVNLYFKDGKFTYEQDAMTDQEVIAWKMDEMNSRITSLQTQQMFNNINLNNSINQQNLYNNNNFITTCPWWDIC